MPFRESEDRLKVSLLRLEEVLLCVQYSLVQRTVPTAYQYLPRRCLMRCAKQVSLVPRDAFNDHLEALEQSGLLPSSVQVPVLPLNRGDNKMSPRRIQEELVYREVRGFPWYLNLHDLVVPGQFDDHRDIIAKSHNHDI